MNAEPITVTDQHTSAAITLDLSKISAGTTTLEVDVTSLSNPQQVPIGIEVSMVSGDLRVKVGSFAFYPADHAGNFLLDGRLALAKMSGKSSVQLVYELKKLRPSAPWGPVRVDIAAPKWRSGK